MSNQIFACDYKNWHEQSLRVDYFFYEALVFCDDYFKSSFMGQ